MMEPAIEYDLCQATIFYMILWVVTGLAVWVLYRFLLKVLKVFRREE